jgi:hypothetical protein
MPGDSIPQSEAYSLQVRRYCKSLKTFTNILPGARNVSQLLVRGLVIWFLLRHQFPKIRVRDERS